MITHKQFRVLKKVENYYVETCSNGSKSSPSSKICFATNGKSAQNIRLAHRKIRTVVLPLNI